jgi:hypothetical protein
MNVFLMHLQMNGLKLILDTSELNSIKLSKLFLPPTFTSDFLYPGKRFCCNQSYSFT